MSCLALLEMMSRSTADHFTCDNASISFFNSTGTDNVTVAIVSPYVNVRKDVYKRFDQIVLIKECSERSDFEIENTTNFITNRIIGIAYKHAKVKA